MADWRGNQGRPRRSKPESNRPAKNDRGKKTPVASNDWRRVQSTTGTGSGATWSTRSPNSEPFFTPHRLKLTGVWGGLIILLGTFIWFVLRISKPTSVYIVGADPTESYADFSSCLTPHFFSTEDTDHINRLDNDTVRTKNITANDIQEAGKKLSWLDNLKFQGPDNCAILYFVGQGSLNPELQPCLLLNGNSNQANAVAVKEILKTLRDKYPKKNKLLLFNVARAGTQWELGHLHNDFATAVDKVVQEINDPRLVVIVSHDDGQTAGNVPFIDGTVFTRYLLAGINGANGVLNKSKISVNALADYLTTGVPQWGKSLGLPYQQPRVIRVKKDAVNFDVVYKTEILPENKEPNVHLAIKANYTELDKLWEKFEKLPEARCRAQQPLLWARAETQLVALERLAVAGTSYQDIFSTKHGNAEKTIEQLQHPLNGLTPRPYSLATWQTRQNNSFQAFATKWDKLQEKDKVTRLDIQRLKNSSQKSESLDLLPVEMKFTDLLESQCDWEALKNKIADDSCSTLIHKAIQCRYRSEQLAALTSNKTIDVRLGIWVHKALADSQAEKRRRDAEDLLFANEFIKSEEIYDELLAAGGPYEVAEQLAQEVGKAYQLCDKALAEAPWLAEWFMQRHQTLMPDNAEQAKTKNGNTTTNPYFARVNHAIRSIYHARRLMHMLNEKRLLGSVKPETITLELKDANQQLANNYDAAHRGFEQLCAALKDGNEETTLQEILGIVQSPLLQHKERVNLHKQLTTIIKDKSSHGIKRFDTEESLPFASGEAQLAARQHTNQWRAALAKLTEEKSHPAQLLLQDETALIKLSKITPLSLQQHQPLSLDDIKQLAKTGSEIRSNLKKATAQLSDKTPPEPNETIEAVYGKLAKRQRDLRAAAWLLARSESINGFSNCTKKMLQIEQFQSSTWLARRALDDFWGDADLPHRARSKGSYYFSRLAEAHIEDAREALKPNKMLHLGTTAYEEIKNTRKVEIKAADALAIRGKRSIKSALQLKYATRIDSNTPTGKIAISVITENAGKTSDQPFLSSQPGGPRRRIGIATNVTPSKEANQTLVTLEQKGDSPTAQIFQLRYRGHWCESPSIRAETISNMVVHEYPKYAGPSVTVNGTARQMTNVMIILDCSYSMRHKVAGEGTDIQKLLAAKLEIRNLISEMNSTEGTGTNKKNRNGFQSFVRVGLVAYGHRLNWHDNTQKKIRVLTNPYAENIADRGTAVSITGLQNLITPNRHNKLPTLPGDDVEILVPLQKLSFRNHASKFDDYLGTKAKEGTLKPWGLTPVYYAIQETAKLLENSYPKGNNHIIVLTDGQNNQDGSQGQIDHYIKYPEKMSFQRKPKIEVISFAVSAEEKKDLQKLTDIATNSADAESQIDLRKNFNEWLQNNVKEPLFAVEPADQSSLAENTENQYGFSKQWRPSKKKWNPGDYNLSTHGLLENAGPKLSLKLEGWEKIDIEHDSQTEHEPGKLTFQGSKQRNEIKHRNLSYVPLNNPNSPDQSYIAAAREPITNTNEENEYNFYVELQNQDLTKQTLAPDFVWVEITPLKGRHKTPMKEHTYRFCDVRCEQNEPVPVLRWTASDWPISAKNAEIKLWALFPGEYGGIVKTSPLSQREAIEHGTEWEWNTRSAAQRQKCLEFTGTSKQTGQKLPNTIIQVDWPADTAIRVERQYSDNKAKHRFYYRNTELPAQTNVQILNVEAMKKKAWKFNKQMIIALPRN